MLLCFDGGIEFLPSLLLAVLSSFQLYLSHLSVCTFNFNVGFCFIFPFGLFFIFFQKRERITGNLGPACLCFSLEIKKKKNLVLYFSIQRIFENHLELQKLLWENLMTLISLLLRTWDMAHFLNYSTYLQLTLYT